MLEVCAECASQSLDSLHVHTYIIIINLQTINYSNLRKTAFQGLFCPISHSLILFISQYRLQFTLNHEYSMAESSIGLEFVNI